MSTTKFKSRFIDVASSGWQILRIVVAKTTIIFDVSLPGEKTADTSNEVTLFFSKVGRSYLQIRYLSLYVTVPPVASFSFSNLT
jgi:hypothetical protein